ncbi:MAG: hypothetical protein JST00_27530 [Deltaproteobacteria bacterium]|nr:hypothetical protein [Deltaproteobacteria bacterium]
MPVTSERSKPLRPLLLLPLLLVACLRRDVSPEEPSTKLSFETVIPQPAIEKVDLIVMVDNSSSMADKQRILADAVPDLVRGLVQPKCVDKKTRQPTGKLSDPLKPESQACDAGSEPAFTPITDMHIGVISSSLGGFGASTCRPEEGRDNDDKAHLLARGPSGAPVAQAGDLHFLAWYPDVEANANKARHPDPPVPATKSVTALGDAFRDLVVGAGQKGCGLEAQLESVYRFLVQPDPWTAIDVTNERASYGPKSRVDGDLLRQRAAFLRPDSLVAVVVLTDEDDSSVDPIAFDGTAWRFAEEASRFRGTSACAKDPSSPSCTSCELAKSDAACSGGGQYTPEQDRLNVRFHQMKRRFGVDPQFPIARYVDAFTKPKVPSRESEHERGRYVGKADCTNPLFAARLPSDPNVELCKLPRGARTKDLVYFAVIGGVPNTLLPASGDASAVDWTKVLGRDPSRYDETGIDPHMIASTEARPGLPAASAPDDADDVHGREWTTGGADLQFACTFDLYERKADGSSARVERACDEASRKAGFCDCDGAKDTPLCKAGDKSVQVKGKAYPTRRELMVAKELGDHGIVASLCPKQLTQPSADDYGYKPAVRAITARLEQSLVATCLPRPLERESEGGPVSCLVLATLPDPGPDSACAKLGLAVPEPTVLAQHRDRLAAEDGEEARALPVCQIPQLVVPAGESCRDAAGLGFCYSENATQVGGPAGSGLKCGSSLLFSKETARLVGARFSMQCIQRTGK